MSGIIAAAVVNFAGYELKKAVTPADFIPDYLLPEKVKAKQRKPRLQRKVVEAKVRDIFDVMRIRQQTGKR
jgi:hypothetical protein